MGIDFEKDIVNKSKEVLVVVDFYGDRCNPCKKLGQLLEKLAEEYKFKLIKANVDQESKLADKFGVMSIPTVVFYKDTEPKEFFVGAYPEAKVREFIEKHK